MRYIPPVTDRNILDVQNGTAKGYFNASDWYRVYNNTRLAFDLAKITTSGIATRYILDYPTIAFVPSLGSDTKSLASLLTNIYNARLMSISDMPTLANLSTYSYASGPGGTSPNYTAVNQWESLVDTIYLGIGAASGYSSWVADSASPVRRARCGVAVADAGLTRNNGFALYD